MADPRDQKMLIVLEDINNSDSGSRYIKGRHRLATATSVKFMDRQTLVCCSYVGRKMYAVQFDLESNASAVIDNIDTIFSCKTTETDLCDTDGNGNVVTSNFFLGSCTHYSFRNDRLTFVRDLPFDLGNFVHGVRFYRPNIIVVTVTRGPTGAYFFNTDTLDKLLHIHTNLNTKDVCFLSDTRLVMLTAHGAPTKQEQESYDSDLHLIDFDLERGYFKLVSTVTYEDSHFELGGYASPQAIFARST